MPLLKEKTRKELNSLQTLAVQVLSKNTHYHRGLGRGSLKLKLIKDSLNVYLWAKFVKDQDSRRVVLFSVNALLNEAVEMKEMNTLKNECPHLQIDKYINVPNSENGCLMVVKHTTRMQYLQIDLDEWDDRSICSNFLYRTNRKCGDVYGDMGSFIRECACDVYKRISLEVCDIYVRVSTIVCNEYATLTLIVENACEQDLRNINKFVTRLTSTVIRSVDHVFNIALSCDVDISEISYEYADSNFASWRLETIE